VKTLIAISLLVAPWLIFAALASPGKDPSTIGLLITLAISAYGLTLLIGRKK
jgi:hypothetical protein